MLRVTKSTDLMAAYRVRDSDCPFEKAGEQIAFWNECGPASILEFKYILIGELKRCLQ